MPDTPESGETFGSRMRGGKPLGQGRTVDVVVGDTTWRTRDQRVEGRTPEGGRFQRVTDQLGNDVTRETTPDGRERQHVKIRIR